MTHQLSRSFSFCVSFFLYILLLSLSIFLLLLIIKVWITLNLCHIPEQRNLDTLTISTSVSSLTVQHSQLRWSSTKNTATHQLPSDYPSHISPCWAACMVWGGTEVRVLRVMVKGRAVVPGGSPRCRRICISWENVRSPGNALPAEQVQQWGYEMTPNHAIHSVWTEMNVVQLYQPGVCS